MLKMKKETRKWFHKLASSLNNFNNKSEKNNVSFTLGMLAIT